MRIKVEFTVEVDEQAWIGHQVELFRQAGIHDSDHIKHVKEHPGQVLRRSIRNTAVDAVFAGLDEEISDGVAVRVINENTNGEGDW